MATCCMTQGTQTGLCDWLKGGVGRGWEGGLGEEDSPRDSQESSPAPQFKSNNSLTLNLLHGSTLTSVHDYWQNHSFDYIDLCQKSDVSAS